MKDEERIKALEQQVEIIVKYMESNSEMMNLFLTGVEHVQEAQIRLQKEVEEINRTCLKAN